MIQLNKPERQEFFPITSLCRNDLKVFPDADSIAIDALSDAEMTHLASALAEDYLSQLYWQSLSTLALEHVPQIFNELSSF